MDFSPRALSRWLPALSIALFVEVVLSLALSLTAPDQGLFSMLRTLGHLPHAAFLLVFAGFLWRSIADGPTRVACQRLLWGGFAAITAVSLARFRDLDFYSTDVTLAWLFLSAAGGILMGIAAPGIWGASLAREQDLQDPRVPTAARWFAWASLAGFVLCFLGEVIVLANVGPLTLWREASLGVAVFAVLQFASRVTLLWCTLVSWRVVEDEAEVLDQARRVRTLMGIWFVAAAGAWVVSSVFRVFDSQSRLLWHQSILLLWHGAVQVTLTLALTILVALALENPGLAYTARLKGPFIPDRPPPSDASPIDVP